MAVSDRDVRLVQVAYPQIYFACHTRHVRRASTDTHLSSTDSTLLAHLDERIAVRPTVLARHLGLAASTMSAAIQRLEDHGYIARSRAAGDGRASDLRLSKKGAAAMQASSVLDMPLVRKMLGHLSARDRKQALNGISLLAKAARQAQEDKR
jgi:MarR family transcriptional regulator, organic hydroperoxide resistance regulator